MYELTVKTPGGDTIINFTEPTFEQYRGAMLALETQGGKIDRLAAGSFLMITCVTNEDRVKLDAVQKDPKVHASVALELYSLLQGYETELKKK